MNKFFKKIIISAIVVAFFIAPISSSFEKNKEGNITIAPKINTAYAQKPDELFDTHATTVVLNQAKAEQLPPESDFGCSINPLTWFRQCIVGMVYDLIWIPISWVTKGAAYILDFFIFYSTNSKAYSANFIGEAWATVRDIANIFFIIALLYVAIQTILGLGHGGKKMIVMTVLAALLINFSLFTTQVVIDASNILAKVFYNHIDPIDANGVPLPPDSLKPKSITVGLVDVFDPQTVIEKKADEPGMTFLIIIISIALMIFMISIFLSVAMLFVGRVAGLWIAMIMSPLAFASFGMPFNIPGFGFAKWWGDLIKQAFLAPVFIFFLYIILLLGKNLKLITYDYTTSDGLLDGIMKVVIPFMIIFILLKMAKKLAVDYSGEIGAMFNKVGGFAMGAIGGAAGLALGAGVGGLAAKVVGSAGLQEKALEKGVGGFGARMALRTADYGSKQSFDFRKGPMGKLMAAQGMELGEGTGLIGLGAEATAGGYKGMQERKQERLVKNADIYKTKMTDAQVQAWSKEKGEQWEKDRAREERSLGRPFNDFDKQAFTAKYGEKPDFTTASQLNEARMNTYKNNLGKTGLLHAVATSTVKKFNPVTGKELGDAIRDYNGKDANFKANNPMPTLANLTESRIKKTKIALGVTAAGLAGPSAIAGLSWLGATVAGGAGAGAYGLQRFSEGAAEEGAAKAIEKELGKTKKIEEEMKTLKASKEKLTKVIDKMKTEAGGADLDEHLNTKIAEMESDFASAKDEESIHRKNRIEAQNAKDIISSDPKLAGQAAALEKQIEDFKTKENNAKNAALVAMKNKQVYTTAKSAEKDLRSIDTRMDVLEGKTHKEKEKTKDGGIPGGKKQGAGEPSKKEEKAGGHGH